MTPHPLILVVDDDTTILRRLKRELAEQDFRVITTARSISVFSIFEKRRPDIVLLDLVMPNQSGFETMIHLKETSNTPIILMTEMDMDDELYVRALELGADDYVTKPINTRALGARIRAILRRSVGFQNTQRVIRSDSDLILDLTRRLVSRDGRTVALTRYEWVILQHMAANVGRVMLNGELLTKAFGPEYRDDLPYIRRYVSNIRHKIERDPSHPEVIKTVPGIGYLLEGEIVSRSEAEDGSSTRLPAHESRSDPISELLERSIEFPAAYKQAGITILGQFADILAREYPEDDISVSIIQNGNRVTLRIARPNGRIEEIERRLDEYGLVITGQMAIEQFTQDRDIIRDLRTSFEITKLELRLKEAFYLDIRQQQENRILNLEEQVSSLHFLVRAGLSHSTVLAESVRSIAATNAIADEVRAALIRIADLTSQPHTKKNEAELTAALKTVQESDSTLYGRLMAQISSIPFGIVSNLATPWVQKFFESWPH